MFKLLAVVSTLLTLGSTHAFEEGFKVHCNSEFTVGREAHRDFFYTIPRVEGETLSIKLLSQDYVCGRKQDEKQKDVYKWLSIPNKELPYNLLSYAWTDSNTTVKPQLLGEAHLNSNDEILFEEAPIGLLKALDTKVWDKEEMMLVTLKAKLKDVLGKKLAQDLLQGKVQLARVNLVVRREFHSGGERFVLEIKRESNGKLYSKLIKK